MRGTQQRRKSQRIEPGSLMNAPDMSIGPPASAGSAHRSIRTSQVTWSSCVPNCTRCISSAASANPVQVHGLALVPQRATTAHQKSCTLYEELNARTAANVGPGQYDSWLLPSRSDFRRPAAQVRHWHLHLQWNLAWMNSEMYRAAALRWQGAHDLQDLDFLSLLGGKPKLVLLQPGSS